MLTAQLMQPEEPSIWDKLKTSAEESWEEVQTGVKTMVITDLADKAQKDVLKFGFWGVVAGALLTTGVSYLAFFAAGTPRALAPAAVLGGSSLVLGAIFITRVRSAVADIPKTMDMPIYERVSRLRPVWFAAGMQTARV